METLLQQITDFATRAHGSQRRKFADEPYINHPVRVMKICRQHTDDICVLAAALLHDVLEDTSTSREQIHDFLKTVMNDEDCIRTLKLVVELTDVYTKAQY
ncbi:MAG TPA: HD domain-containing protein, partial [Chitinophagaceae bacterium]|nr:HD domain-containing protein [Chitinophagaceae bacterium]